MSSNVTKNSVTKVKSVTHLDCDAEWKWHRDEDEHFSQPKSVFVVQLIFKVCKSDNNIGLTTPTGGFCVLLRWQELSISDNNNWLNLLSVSGGLCTYIGCKTLRKFKQHKGFKNATHTRGKCMRIHKRQWSFINIFWNDIPNG